MKTILKALRSMTRVASIEREAAALQRATDLENQLLDLIRAIHTAPMTTRLSHRDAAQAYARGTGIEVQAPHLTWRPLWDQEEKAMALLGYRTTQARAQALSGGRHG